MRRSSLHLSLFVILGCNGGTADDSGSSPPGTTEASPSSGETTANPTGSETGQNPTSGPDATTSGPGTSETTEVSVSSGPDLTTTSGPDMTTTTGEDTSTGTAETGTSSGEDTSTGDTTTGGGEGDYAAFFVAGGLDRIVVRKRDLQADLCTTVVFVWPGQMDPMGFDVALPGDWGWQNAMIHQGAADCLVFMMFPMNPAPATSAVGASTWAPQNGCPAALDIDLALTFDMVMPWVPAMDQLDAQAIPVQGC